MTDIHRHLPTIFKLVRQQVSEASTMSKRTFTASSYQTAREALRALLPQSYGIGCGMVVGTTGATSEPCEIILYDIRLAEPQSAPEGARYNVASVLATLYLHTRHDRLSLRRTLENIQSVKRLQERRRSRRVTQVPGKKADSIPGSLLPLGIICFSALQEYEQASIEELCLELNRLLRLSAPDERPDYLWAFAHHVVYRHPLLYPGEPATYDLGFVREPELTRPRTCYICKSGFFRRHFFYEQLCQRCGDLNYTKRIQTANLGGKVALITGGRIKIGYAVALRLLRAGAEVIVTTRFPHDAAARYAHEADFSSWQARLHICGLDLRHLPSIEDFTSRLQDSFKRLDILVNNAAQSVRRPPAFYAHLLPGELLDPAQLPDEQRSLLFAPEKTSAALLQPRQENNSLTPLALTGNETAAALSQIPLLAEDHEHDPASFPPGLLDIHGQQIDKRARNSWVMGLDEVQLPEMLEVQLINVTAPFLLITRLKPLLLKQSGEAKFILNVSSMEGSFSQEKFSGQHPHTNMAKAALNMLTYTSAQEYAREGIYMNSIDPGWISHQVTYERLQVLEKEAPLPLDEQDAAARICDPLFVAFNEGRYLYGKFLKDYSIINW